MRLFDTLLQPGQTAVVDADSDVAARVIAAVPRARPANLFTVGAKGEAISCSIAGAREGFATRLESATSRAATIA